MAGHTLLIGIRLIAYLVKRLRESSTIKQPRKLIMHRKLLQSTVGILEHGQESVRGFSVSDNTEYRRNILAELGFDRPPETWDELIDMLPALQRNHGPAFYAAGLSAGFPVVETAAAVKCHLKMENSLQIGAASLKHF